MLLLSLWMWSICSSEALSLYSYAWYDCSYIRIFSSSASIRSSWASSSIFSSWNCCTSSVPFSSNVMIWFSRAWNCSASMSEFSIRRANRYRKLPASYRYNESLLLTMYSIAYLRFSHLTVPYKLFWLNHFNYYNIGSFTGSSCYTKLLWLDYSVIIFAALVVSSWNEALNCAILSWSRSYVPNPTSSVSDSIELFKWFRHLAVRLLDFLFTIFEQKLLDIFRWSVSYVL